MTLVPLDFQFPLWDTVSISHSFTFLTSTVPLDFQFPLWDTYSIYLPEAERRSIFFQFPLWDTLGLLRLLFHLTRRGVYSFNSLYGILMREKLLFLLLILSIPFMGY